MEERRPNRRQRRKSEAGTQDRIEPTLVAFLICRSAGRSDDGSHNITGIFDGLTATAVVPPGSSPDLSTLAVPVQFVLFTRWVGGSGIFKQWIDVTGPDQAVQSTDEVDFWLRDQFKAHNVITRVNLGAKEGVYYFDVKLDGKSRGRIPLKVKFEIIRPTAPQQT